MVATGQASAGDFVRRFVQPIVILGLLGAILLITGCLQNRPWAAPTVAVQASRVALPRTVSQWLDEKRVGEMTAAQWAVIARRNSVVVLNSWNFRLIPILKRANPHVRVWVYKNLSGIRSDDCTTLSGSCGDCHRGVTDSEFLSSGMGYCWTVRRHPHWFLRNSLTGRRFQFRYYPEIWATDYGSHDYQQRWIRNVLADVRAHGWDGVAVDNALTTANAYGIAAKYRSDMSVQAATYSALRTIGKALRRAGVASVFNVGHATRFSRLWQRWLRPVGGLAQEFYLARSPGSSVVANWRTYEDEISSCVTQHKTCWFQPADSAAPGTSAYALASYLIAADGRQLLGAVSAASMPQPCWQLGAPEGPRQRVGLAWRRFFNRGVAVVNPTDEPLTVSLGGSYMDMRGHGVAAITLQPASGAVMRTIRSEPAGAIHGGSAIPANC